MRVTLDIHHFDQQYEHALRNMEQSAITARNKSLIRAYCDACLLRQVCGKVRLIRAVIVLAQFARRLTKDFDQLARPDVEALLAQLLARQPTYSVETISTYKKILRRFVTYVAAPDDFPHVKELPTCVAWINAHIRPRDRPVIRRSDLLTPPEIEILLRTARNDRDRAFVAVLWEAGPRISEIGNMQIRNVSRATNGYILDITGKTGTRTPLVVSSAPYLDQWLAKHPFRNDPEAPLWVRHRDRSHVKYSTMASMLQRLFRIAGIAKPFHPHIFRHSRVTYVLANAIMNEQQAKTYFGWTSDSDVIGSTYAHLTDADANNAVLRENNLAPHQRAQDELQPVTCRICQALNAPRSEYCQRCQAVLDLKKAYEHQQLHDAKENLLRSMFRVLVEKGLVDDAARAVHDANLGDVLKRLAQHASGERPITDRNDSRSPVVDVKQTPAA